MYLNYDVVTANVVKQQANASKLQGDDRRSLAATTSTIQRSLAMLKSVCSERVVVRRDVESELKRIAESLALRCEDNEDGDVTQTMIYMETLVIIISRKTASKVYSSLTVAHVEFSVEVGRAISTLSMSF